MPHTENVPKCFAEVKGACILDWGLKALHAGGLDDVVFIGGYRIESIQSAYPAFTFCHNADWPNNNILISLMHAEAYMADGFVCAYSDILYTPDIVERLMSSSHDITLVCDTAWRERYVQRTEHPEWDAEKMAAKGDRVVAINRTMESEEARGEYIGVARFTPHGVRVFREAFQQARRQYNGNPFRAAKTFQKAYLIDLFQEMIESGIAIHQVETPGGYMEIDTNQDFQIARKEWIG